MQTKANRIRQFHIRLSEEERSQMQQKAKEAGCRTSDFIRKCGLEGKVCPVPSVNVKQWVELAATTANLNQLTRLANEGRISPAIEPVLLDTAKVLREVRSSLIGET